ncbi:hypothetical protein CLIB1444_03S09802 [[Candida] jaroonii]|uniref:Uncharacterized protein n=1 Tax=[Candida] jaroonii TaxID=467808 RepID=A0ACA9Y5T3_9ASCO|nr:hypothetical protein CLIB1444_03S09802 [[Candida] jaroonii]
MNQDSGVSTQLDPLSHHESNSPKMNYSPKHSRKSSSLSSNRNINMKNLSLNLESTSTSPNFSQSQNFTNLRQKSLTISIPNETSPKVNNNSNGSLTQNGSQQSISPIKFSPPKTSKNYKFPPLKDQESPVNNSFLNNFKNLNLPEELQELSQLDAYSKGPANVLNDCIFLYSEPTIEQINDFDLVINVAKECPNLSDQFDNSNNKQYLYIPWNHTSSISKELPRLTDLIAQYDDSDLKDGKKRKILVHCHCGVSRSACVVVAYFMKKFNINTNEAYDLLKNGSISSTNDKFKQYFIESCNRICPNMSLIFELIDFNEYLQNGTIEP